MYGRIDKFVPDLRPYVVLCGQRTTGVSESFSRFNGGGQEVKCMLNSSKTNEM